MLVKIGDDIKVGNPLFHDKKQADLTFLSPVSGLIEDIVFGPRRRIDCIVVKVDELQRFVEFNSNLDGKELLIKSGLWGAFRAFPFRNIPKTSDIPYQILISMDNLDSFHVDSSVLFDRYSAEFFRGLDLIKKSVELRNIFLKIVLLSILILIFLIPLFLSDRISDYFSQIYILIKNSSTEIETLRIGSQTKDLMPLLKFAGYIINLEIKYIIFGNGSLSSYYFGAHEFAHPHSFLTRIFFDNGILGFMIYSLFIFSALNKNSNLLEKFTLSFAYGSFLSVHSSFLFVFLMILMYFKKTNFNKS